MQKEMEDKRMERKRKGGSDRAISTAVPSDRATQNDPLAIAAGNLQNNQRTPVPNVEGNNLCGAVNQLNHQQMGRPGSLMSPLHVDLNAMSPRLTGQSTLAQMVTSSASSTATGTGGQMEKTFLHQSQQNLSDVLSKQHLKNQQIQQQQQARKNGGAPQTAAGMLRVTSSHLFRQSNSCLVAALGKSESNMTCATITTPSSSSKAINKQAGALDINTEIKQEPGLGKGINQELGGDVELKTEESMDGKAEIKMDVDNGKGGADSINPEVNTDVGGTGKKNYLTSSASATSSRDKKPVEHPKTGNGNSSSSDVKIKITTATSGNIITAGASTPSKSSLRKIWNPEVLNKTLLPVLQKLLHIEPHSRQFRQPIGKIRDKLENGIFKDPWEFVDNVWLMFDNAWLHNRKTTQTYKHCTHLSNVFGENIDGIMQHLGYCCGRKYAYNKVEPEPLVECQECGRKLHQVCVLHLDSIWTNGFTCDNCHKANNTKRKDNTYTAKLLNRSKVSSTTNFETTLENRINFLLKAKEAGAGAVTIRVLSCTDKSVKVKPLMKQKFVDTEEMQGSFPYRAKAIFAFEEINDVDVCFFGMHVQEYGSECDAPNTRRVYIAYLDSVHFFEPRDFRTAVYHEILIGYLNYVKSLGYTMVHIWACPPSEGDDYIFHRHPPEQKIPRTKDLSKWYKGMLDKAKSEGVILDYKDIFQDAEENSMSASYQYDQNLPCGRFVF